MLKKINKSATMLMIIEDIKGAGHFLVVLMWKLVGLFIYLFFYYQDELESADDR